jgi:hypothetical protein
LQLPEEARKTPRETPVELAVVYLAAEGANGVIELTRKPGKHTKVKPKVLAVHVAQNIDCTHLCAASFHAPKYVDHRVRRGHGL